MRQRVLPMTACASLLAAAACSAASTDPVRADDHTARVAAIASAEIARQKIPGLSVAVVRDGRLVVARGFGFANLEHRVPATEHTIYQSGSVGKQFTAAAVMLLVEEGRLSLDDRLATFFEGSPAFWKNVTVRHLLTHTSGIPDYTDDAIDYRRDYTNAEFVRLAQTLAPGFAPGEKWSYSNTGYLLLGLIIEAVGGQFYGDFLGDRVFGPLAMKTARVISEADIVPNRAAGYRMVKGEWKNQEYVAPTLNRTADGALYLTVLDLVKWDAALRERRVFQPSSYEAMWTPITLNDGTTEPYGFGWRLAPTNGRPTIAHSGAWQGFLTRIARYGDELTVIVLLNSALANTERIEQAIAAAFIPELAPPDHRQAADVDPSVTALASRFVKHLSEGRLDRALLTPDLARTMSDDRIAGLKAQLESPGRWTSVVPVGHGDEEGHERFTFRIDYDGPTMLLDLSVADREKIADLDLRYD